jgi:hypothetical protein
MPINTAINPTTTLPKIFTVNVPIGKLPIVEFIYLLIR